MKLRSWHLAFLGLLIYFVFSLNNILINLSIFGSVFEGTCLPQLDCYVYYAQLVLMPLTVILLFKSLKTRRIGAILSSLMGLILIRDIKKEIDLYLFMRNYRGSFMSNLESAAPRHIFLMLIPCLLFFLAAILYFLKENKPESSPKTAATKN